ncbi:adenylyltransferase/cytidyltransferase family protein [Catenovulum sp. 2E275]|uniref:adenylyltransferase/cytidyltransferase family protein n=1 Tax=Catenovulum sp. 2E275 TaxID=2980497 RepID=UPI0021D3148C|nr:adenylyltransferase/cytidyltransferase family protein [Catenovulum sp. 2E275]MCU4676766.1 adenylyltransferase/cytidyltransferase family protein [Catenovulum sp. 2E275]
MNKNRVLALGVFDLFHVGHLNFLKFARQQGDELIVGVAPDAMCFKSKGKNPVINQTQRMEIIKALGIVSDVTLVKYPIVETQNVVNWMQTLNINTVVSGIQWQNTDRWNQLIPKLAAHHINVIFAPATPDISSTQIKQSIVNLFLADSAKIED